MSKFISCVRFKVKQEYLEELDNQLRKFALPKGANSHTVVKTGDFSFCTFIHWDNQDDLINARPEMIAYLDTIRDLLVELSPELGVTDPVSGPIIHISKI